MGKLDGQVALVTGGSAGIGFASAKALAEEGARVVLLGRREPELKAAVAELGEGASFVCGDVTRMDDLDRLFAEIERVHGGLDILVANAGGVGGGPLATCSEEAFDTLMTLNVKSVFFTVQKALPLLRKPASIVVIGSVAGEIALPGGSVYCATKGALRSLVRAWAAELAPRDVRVNLVGPGITETPLVGRIDAGGGGDGLDGLIRARGAIHRRGRPEEVAAAVRFLASPESAYTTGIALYVDGGITSL
jgi:NAD(P)-dependent dehydrogenase (short-subunit alcohol dehydrogenase family)